MSKWYDMLVERFENKPRSQAVRKLDPQKGEKILEIGFGSGRSLCRIADAIGPTGKVCGVDLSQGMFDITRSRLSKAGLAVRVILIRDDVIQFPFEAGFFDAAFLSFTLELFEDRDIPIVLSICLKALRPGGRICILALSRSQRPKLGSRIYEWLHTMFPQFLDCRPIYIEKSLEEAGFQILGVESLSLGGIECKIVLGKKSID